VLSVLRFPDRQVLFVVDPRVLRSPAPSREQLLVVLAKRDALIGRVGGSGRRVGSGPGEILQEAIKQRRVGQARTEVVAATIGV